MEKAHFGILISNLACNLNDEITATLPSYEENHLLLLSSPTLPCLNEMKTISETKKRGSQWKPDSNNSCNNFMSTSKKVQK